jgi:adenylate cyclase
MKTKPFLFRALAALLIAAAFTAAAGLGVLDGADGAVSDALYQRGAGTDGEIVIIGMDQRAVDSLGPMPWPRDAMADAIAYLNADPDARPAVIGIDVLYVGESADPGADAYLAQAAGEYDNVAVASMATFGSAVVETDGGFYVDRRSVLALDTPFAALADVADTGHINAMPDRDGIIRHAMLYVDAPAGRLPALSRVIYERWCRWHGLAPNPAPPTDDAGFFYLPFTARPGSYYDGVSVIDLIDGETDPDYFAGKIVLIGPYTAGMQDEYRTAVDHAVPMYGIEILANQIDAYRAGNIPRQVNRTLQLVVLFVLTWLAAVFFHDRKMALSIGAWLGVCAAWLIACWLGRRGGYVLHVLWVPLAVTLLFIASVAVNYVRAARERRRISDTFGRYVAPAIMKELLGRGGDALELGGRMYDIAVLFVDIRGFTAMSEAMEPPTVVEIINQYLTLTTECITRYHGTLDKFVGDCTMAFWNAPLPQDDYVYLACRAAMDMVEGSKALGEQLMARFGRSVTFGVGVHVGPAVVGNIGAPRRMDYTAIGDTVNTAARLESNAPGGNILISPAEADILGALAGTTSLGDSIKLKGKADGFEALTLDRLAINDAETNG